MSAPERLREQGAHTGRRLGSYHLCELLASGGMAEVYRALDQTSGREVAIKAVSITHTDAPDVGARFRSEAQRLASFRHKHIVPLYAFGEADDLLYFVMPLVPGSLRKRLDVEGRLPPAQATRVALQVASALCAAHAQGLVHRDIKPENILIDRHGDAFLTDFGIARELAALQLEGVTWTLSSIGLPVGTPEYMPPEQLRGEPADQRVDVYALGAVLYETLTGQAPHEGATPWAVAAQVLLHQITPPSAYAPDIWPDLEQVVLTALAGNAHDRHADMRSFEEALRDALGVMEEQWETYLDLRPEATARHAERRRASRDTTLLSGGRRTAAMLAPARLEAATRRSARSWLKTSISGSALLRLWRLAHETIARAARNSVASAALSLRTTTPGYRARADFLRQELARYPRYPLRWSR